MGNKLFNQKKPLVVDIHELENPNYFFIQAYLLISIVAALMRRELLDFACVEHLNIDRDCKKILVILA